MGDEVQQQAVTFQGEQGQAQSPAPVPVSVPAMGGAASQPGQTQPGQTQQPGPVQGTKPAEQQTLTITRQEVEAMIQQAVDRAKQGAVDKANDRMTKFVEERFAQITAELKSQGYTLPEKEAQQLKDSLSKAQADPQREALTTYVNQRSQAIYQEVGVVLNEDDPEAEDVDSSTPESFLVTLRAATLAKAERMKRAGGASAARAPTMSGGGRPAELPTNHPGDLIRAGLNKPLSRR